MSTTLVNDCPRCGTLLITFDVVSSRIRHDDLTNIYCEFFSICRKCRDSAIFAGRIKKYDYDRFFSMVKPEASNSVISGVFNITGYISVRDEVTESPPEHTPADVANVFTEAATCLSVQCWNAAAAMFRKCIDIATTPMLPAEDEDGLNRNIRRTLGHRLNWLFATKRLPEELRDLATCIKEDGNDGAHTGALTKADAEDLLDFTIALLTRMYTEPERLRIAAQRRVERRQVSNT